MNRKLLVDSAVYTAANLVSRIGSLLGLALLPLFLDMREYGVIGLVAAVAAIVNILVPLEISQGLARFYASAPAEEQAKVASTAWWFTAGMLTVAATLGLILHELWSELLFGSRTYRTVFLVAIAFWWGNTAFLFLQNQFRWSFRPRAYAIFSSIFAVSMLGGSILLAALSPWPVLGALCGWALGALATAVLAFRTLKRSLSASISLPHLKRLLRYSLPLVPASLAILATTYSSRFFLNNEGSLSQVGLLTFASQIAAIPSFIILGLQSAITPHVMASYERPDTPLLLARLFEAVLIVGLAGSFAIAALWEWVLPVVGYAAYSSAGTLVLFLGPAFLFQQLYIFAPGFAISQRTGIQAGVCIFSGALAAALNYILINKWGVTGAAVATLAAAASFMIVWFALAQRFYRIPVRWLGLGTVVISLTAAGQIGRVFENEWSAALALIALLAVVLAAAPMWWPAAHALRLSRPDQP